MEKKNSPSLTAKSIYAKLKEAGYPKPFIQKILPEWWDNSLIKTSAGAFQFALILNQKLGIRFFFAEDGELIIEGNSEQFRFKHSKNTKPSELTISANIGKALSNHALFCIKHDYIGLESDPLLLRRNIIKTSSNGIINFESLLMYCWRAGVPVLFLNDLPRSAKKMTGMALCIQDRPVIVLGFKNKQVSRQLFVLAHEMGHIACGHVSQNRILVDESINEVNETIKDTPLIKRDQDEKEADSFALKLIRGRNVNPLSEFDTNINSTTLAATAILESQKLNIDAGHLITSYAKLYGDWPKAGLAMNFIPSQDKAIDLLEESFFLNSDLTKISDENRDFLISAQGYTAS
ncbi:ImmA/IrrE family metallo-endopeptidase [Lonsdalea quercina]|uniref:ImmA/IrrE family metallo-endopeptidase n=1 Tax=Lonsdalea quercina TaxID=71657 RepID=UPI003977208E